jgi:hypothetical protein
VPRQRLPPLLLLLPRALAASKRRSWRQHCMAWQQLVAMQLLQRQRLRLRAMMVVQQQWLPPLLPRLRWQQQQQQQAAW